VSLTPAVNLPPVSTSGEPYVENIFEIFLKNQNGSKVISGGRGKMINEINLE
jgi:hypothetical protein